MPGNMSVLQYQTIVTSPWVLTYIFCRDVWNLKAFQEYLLAEKNLPEIRNVLCTLTKTGLLKHIL